MRIPVMVGDTCIELVSQERVRTLLTAPNVRAIRRPKDRKVIQLRIEDLGRTPGPARHGDPRRYSHDHETPDNPVNVWTLRRIPTSARSIFGTAVNDCAA